MDPLITYTDTLTILPTIFMQIPLRLSAQYLTWGTGYGWTALVFFLLNYTILSNWFDKWTNPKEKVIKIYEDISILKTYLRKHINI